MVSAGPIDAMPVPVLFISQTAGVPSAFWNRMSDLRSPLKSFEISG